jgi:hypothetical protein
VYPNPGWSGSTANFARVGVRLSSWIWGLATMSN